MSKKLATELASDLKNLSTTVTALHPTNGPLQYPTAPSNDDAPRAASIVDVGIKSAIAYSTWHNPYVQDAIHVLEQLSEVGKALPFVSPACIVLKIIIDVETRFREADAKCQDLLERITSMLSLLPVLTDVEMNDMILQVLERVLGALKNSAGLIQAYRKQGAFARRLHVKNRDRFTSCAGLIARVTTDLMFALQIHQTAMLDSLRRVVPVDEQDATVDQWLAAHGGADSLRKDPALMSQLAEQLHVTLDDDALAQINSNMTLILEHNREEIDKTIVQSTSTAVMSSLEEIARRMADRELEPLFTCVQCEQSCRISENAQGSCRFHQAPPPSRGGYPCCWKEVPCQANYHRFAHHCDYPYGPFFSRAENIINDYGTRDVWITLEDVDLDTSTVIQRASVSQLLRWVGSGSQIEESTIVLCSGKFSYDDKYFLETWTAKGLAVAARVAKMTNDKVIYRSSVSPEEYSMAEWSISSEGVINGIILTVKPAISETPFRSMVPISASARKVGDVQTISLGGDVSYTPETPYILPPNIVVTGSIPTVAAREPRQDFETRTASSLPVVMKAAQSPHLIANSEFSSWEADTFESAMTVFNAQPFASNSRVVIAAVSATFRLVGDESYSPISEFIILNRNERFPITIEPRQTWKLEFKARVPRTDEDKASHVTWKTRAFVARHRPLRLKVTVEDVQGAKAYLILEWVMHPFRSAYETKREDDIAYFFIEDPLRWAHYGVHVSPCRDFPGTLVMIGVQRIKVQMLKKIVRLALLTNETEVNMNLENAENWSAYALVDLSCRRVYAFKILLLQDTKTPKKTIGCVGYVLCPEYAAVLPEKRPIQYAAEKVQLPQLEPLPDIPQITDDAFDDYVQSEDLDGAGGMNSASAKPSTSAPGDPTNQISWRLASIDNRLGFAVTALDRLATAMEQIAEAHTKIQQDVHRQAMRRS